MRGAQVRRVALLVLTLLFIDTAILMADAFAGGRGGGVSVKGYTRKDGTYVQPHTRSALDRNPTNNYSFQGTTTRTPARSRPGTRTRTWRITTRSTVRCRVVALRSASRRSAILAYKAGDRVRW
jgi:hypothetical protein